MKRLLIVFLLFQISNCISQNKDVYGTIYYSYISNINKALNQDNAKQNVKDFFKEINDYTADVKFKLDFYNQTAVFTIDNKMDSDINPNAKLFAEKLISNGSYFSNLKNDQQFRMIDKELLIELKPSKIKWVLTQETKFIKNYKCFKASTTVTNKNATGEYIFEITAWYTPDIPVSFGPKQFIGLPGLVLELKDTHNTFYVDRIELFPKEKPIIKPFKGKIISEKKYNEKIEENLRGFMKN